MAKWFSHLGEEPTWRSFVEGSTGVSATLVGAVNLTTGVLTVTSLAMGHSIAGRLKQTETGAVGGMTTLRTTETGLCQREAQGGTSAEIQVMKKGVTKRETKNNNILLL